MSRGLQCMKQGTRIVFMGNGNVGKTSIVKRFLFQKFYAHHEKTVEDMYRTSFRSCQMDILDTSGSYHFPVMQEYAILTGDVFVLVFAWDDESSFDKVHDLIDTIREKSHSQAKIIVAANKIDLEKSKEKLIEREMIVSIDWDCYFQQCSAKNDSHVTTLFERIVELVAEKHCLERRTVSKLKRAMRRIRMIECLKPSKLN